MAVPLGDIDLSPMGLNFVLTNATLPQIDDLAFDIIDRVQNIHSYDLRKVFGVFVPDNALSNSRIQFSASDDSIYQMDTHLGNGTFGAVGRVSKLNGPNAGTQFALKEQVPNKNNDSARNAMKERAIIKEAIIQYVLFVSQVANPHNPIPGIFEIGKVSTPYVDPAGNHVMANTYCFITECLDRNLQSYLTENLANPMNLAYELFYFYKDIVSKLQTLFTNCNFNHGDFKADNVMFSYSTQEYKLIDFGFSRLTYSPGQVIECNNYFNNISTDNRDISMITLNLSLYILRNALGNAGIPGDMNNYININLINDPNYWALSWLDTYLWLNGQDTTATFAHALTEINRIELRWGIGGRGIVSLARLHFNQYIHNNPQFTRRLGLAGLVVLAGIITYNTRRFLGGNRKKMNKSRKLKTLARLDKHDKGTRRRVKYTSRSFR